MIFRNIPVQVIALVAICTSVLIHNVSGSSSRSKSGPKGKSTSAAQTSGHQYGSLLLKPSKPDPHFDILDEQKGYKNYYRSRLREGRTGSHEVKPTKLREVSLTASTANSKKGCCRRKGKSKSVTSTSLLASPSSHSSSYESQNQAQFTFMKKSTEKTQPKFSGSMLISGDGGMSESFRSHTQGNLVRDGWKILMGPSVTPEEETSDDYAYKNNDVENSENTLSKRTFTSLTDGAAKHRTISKLSQRRLPKAKTTSASNLKYSTVDDFSSLKRITGVINGGAAKSRRTSSSSQKSRAIPQVSVPRQELHNKYAKIATATRRNPSKSYSGGNSGNAKIKAQQSRPAKKVNKVTMTNGKTSQYSTPVKTETRRSQTHYSKPVQYSSQENSIASFNPSPVMTLDTKKLVLESISSSAEPSTIPMMMTFSPGGFSGEKITEPMRSDSAFAQSQFNRLSGLSLDHEDLIIEDDEESNYGHQFETKTAMNVGEYSPLISVSTSMKYPNHHDEQGGVVTAASSEDAPQILLHPLDIHPLHHHHPLVDHLEDGHEHEHEHMPTLQNGIVNDNIVHIPPPALPASPHLDFFQPGSTSGRILVPQLHGVHSASSLIPHPSNSAHFPGFGSSDRPSSQLPLKLPPFRRLPLPLPNYEPEALHHPPSESHNSHFHVDLSSGYPKILADSVRSPELLHDSLPGPTNLHALPIPAGPPSHPSPFILPQHPHSPQSHPNPNLHHLPPLPPFPLTPVRKPIGIPIDVESGRKAPPTGHVIEIGKHSLSHSPPPPPPGVDPDHPAIQHLLRNPHSLLRDGIYIEPTDTSNIPETTKNYLQLQYSVHKNTLIPLDKRLVYLSMIFSWMFWITAFYTYYRFYINGNKAKQIMLNVPTDGKNPQVVTARKFSKVNKKNPKKGSLKNPGIPHCYPLPHIMLDTFLEIFHQ